MSKISTVSIVGGSGYAGGELLRILLNHPSVEIKQVTSQRLVGQPLSVSHPNLRGQTKLKFSSVEDLQECDVLFLGLPNGVSMDYIEKFKSLATHIIDLGADFRLNSESQWSEWYKKEHVKPELMSQFAYGLPELNRDQIAGSNYVSGPGCEAAVSILSLYPLIKHGVIDPTSIIIDAKMGSSQAGNSFSSSSHHPERAGVLRSYAPTGHRHTAEIEQELGEYMPEMRVNISATAVNIVRGILVTIHTNLNAENLELTDKDIRKIYRQEYRNEPFVRIVKQSRGLFRYPEPKILQGTNFCEIGFEIDRRSNRLVILGAIDNLVKGTAGNGVQCMNLMLGLEERSGLGFMGLHPI
ncbi:MAG: N-acetyl-gamma-glutamyl-phosphate reductase [Candidatus Pacebacteria bacterium]|nr:N-acetyl-gamma-glutamyl-phosphate reductase [Candidatus Paceibacterota bacterium]